MFDWSKIAKVNFDDQRRERLGLKTGKQLFSEAHENMRKAEEHQAWRARVEPLIKSHLLDHMVGRKPIEVLVPITNYTESIPGQEDDDDGFYQMQKSTSLGSFQLTTEIIPAGTELMFKSHDKTLGQLIFSGSNGKEYAIYQQATLPLPGGKTVENPGFFGLLHNTNLRKLID